MFRLLQREDDIMKPQNNLEDLFIYSPEWGDDLTKGTIFVRVKTNPKDTVGKELCVVSLGRSGFWRIGDCFPNDYIDHVRYIKFHSKEQAAITFYTICQKVGDIVNHNPLPEIVKDYLQSRAESLRQRERELLSEFWNIYNERCKLRQMAEQNHIDSVMHYTDDTDQEAMVRKLLEFNVSIPKQLLKKNDFGKCVEVPLFSEQCLYALFGKDDARTILSLVSTVCQKIAPNVTREIL